MAILKSITNFLDISLDEVINVGVYQGLDELRLKIEKLIQEFPDWDLALREETKKLHRLKQKFIEEVHMTYKTIQKIESMENKFNDIHSNEQLEERESQPPKKIKEIVEKRVPLKVEETIQAKEPLVSNKKSTMKILLHFLLKSGIFILSFITPTVLLFTILIIFFYWNYLALLQYQPVLFFLLIIVMLFVGIVSGYLSLLLIRYYIKKRKERLEYEKCEREFNKKTPYEDFIENKGTPTQWIQKFEKFLESKKKDNI